LPGGAGGGGGGGAGGTITYGGSTIFETWSGGAGGAGGFVAGGGGASGGQTGSPDAAPNQCVAALPIKCGDSVNHSTLVQGRANLWSGYSATARSESGRETVYVLSAASACTVVARLADLTTDLDLMLLGACDPGVTAMASSTPLDLQTVETVSWTSRAGESYYLVVDGYAGATGSYTLEVDCTCP
jgi:hypothetical protein